MINNIEDEILNINLFKGNSIKIEKIDLGHSGAYTYYITVKNTEYFLKIIENSNFNEVKEKYNNYVSNKINVPKLIECGKFSKNFSYYVYESLGRMTLKRKMEFITLDEIYNIGVFIGKENKRLMTNHNNRLNSSDLANECINTIKSYYHEFLDLLEENKEAFTLDEYSILCNSKLKLLLDDLFILIKNEEVVYCHNDIKTNNIMFKNNKLYFIDIENTSENFFYKTLGANIFTILPETNKKYAEFYNGVFSGFYDFNIPTKAKDYLVLNYLSQMLKKINHCITKENNIDNYVNNTKEFAHSLFKSNYFKSFDFSFLKINKKYELLDIEIKRISVELKEKFNYNLVKKIEGGYSNAISLQLEKDNQNYFCKICDYKIDLNYIKNVLNIYEKLNINSLRLSDYGTLFNGQYFFVIYNYIDGVCLNDYIKEKKLTNTEIVNFGIKVGSIAKRLKNYKDYNSNNFNKLSIIDETRKIKYNLNELLNESGKRKLISKYIDIEDFNKLIVEFIKYSNSFKNEKVNLVHQDLKTANIMISNNKLYVIDIASMALSYNVFDFKCTITWELIKSYEYEINFLNGYFNGLYDYKIPKILFEQLKYIFLYDFFRSLYQLLNENNINYEKIDNYINGVLNIIYKIELKNVFDFKIGKCYNIY